jgi:hypothetical protein
MNEVLIKKILRDKVFLVFLAGLALALLLGTFFWFYSVLKTIYMIDELTDQNFNNKEVTLSQTASNHDKENVPKPAAIAAPQVPSERVEKALLSVDTVAEVEEKPIIDNKKISKQIPVSREQLQPVSGQAAGTKELQKAATANHNLNNSVEKSITAKISTLNGNTSQNYKSDGADELYKQITVKQKQTKEENDSQADAINSNDPVEKPAADSMDSVVDQNEKDTYDQVVGLQLEIERLDERIESGLSDIDYDHYFELKRSDFVLHDRERRMDFQFELELDLPDQ